MRVKECDIVEYEDHVEITIIEKDGEIRSVVLLDKDIANELIGLTICEMGNGYIWISSKEIKESVHRYVMKPKEDYVVDHINGIRSDNRRCNLRVCNNCENGFNRKIQSNNSSGHRGVCKWTHSKKERWMAYMHLDGKRHHIGYYDTIDEAIAARLEFEKIHRKEFIPDEERERVEYERLKKVKK